MKRAFHRRIRSARLAQEAESCGYCGLIRDAMDRGEYCEATGVPTRAAQRRELLCNTAACNEISPLCELAKGRFTPDRNLPACLGCQLARPGDCGGEGSRVAAGEPISFRCGVTDERGHTCN